MTTAEILGRIRDYGNKLYWRTRQVRVMDNDPLPILKEVPSYNFFLPPGVHSNDVNTVQRIKEAANGLLEGHWQVFNCLRTDMTPIPDWFMDPRTGQRAPETEYAFDINCRSEEAVGNIKYIWELSRHQYLTVMSSAYYLSGDTRYSDFVFRHLSSWWSKNPFLSGPNWTSGIEVGLRLVSWIWIRRLLHTCPEVTGFFEKNPTFIKQLYHHQEFLNTLMSHGSSANNHIIAEAAGLFVASCNFPYFKETARWRKNSSQILRKEIILQTFPSGLNRELATAYHGFVLELMLVAGLEGEFTGNALGSEVWNTIQAMVDALAAIVDVRLNAPRQGDADDGFGLLLDCPEVTNWSSLLATGKALFGELDWWPLVEQTDIRTTLWSQMTHSSLSTSNRPKRKKSFFPDAGMVILRTVTEYNDEVWCRCDHGPHGFLSLSAHAHADALSIEVRVNGVEVLVDPGTFCYHGDPTWRSYFRSTIAHNTLELENCNQIDMGGPFLWEGDIESTLLNVQENVDGDIQEWCATHNGYQKLTPPAIHQRTVTLNSKGGEIVIKDCVKSEGMHNGKLAFHLGPTITCSLEEGVGKLEWNENGKSRYAFLFFPINLTWSIIRGMSEPPLGWYSPAFDEKIQCTTFIGRGSFGKNTTEITKLQFS